MKDIGKWIIIINGSGGSGKDTFCNLVGEKIPSLNISTIEPAKRCLKELVGIDYVEGETPKTEKLRKLLSSLKQLSIEFNDYATKYVINEIDKFNKDEKNKIMFIHMREPSEIKKTIELVESEYPDSRIISLLVENDNIPKITSNDSDKNVFEYRYDYKIDNSGTLEDLDTEICKFLHMLLKFNLYKKYTNL